MNARSPADRLWVVPTSRDGLLSRSVALVATGRAPEGFSAGVLVTDVERPVYVLPRAEVPPGVVVIDRSMADRLEIGDPDTTEWRLSTDVSYVGATELVLDPVTALAPEDIARRFTGAAAGGTLLWVPGGADPAAVTLELAGITFRLHEVTPAPAPGGTLYQVNQSTRIRLFGSYVRKGIDIVVLADCSNSMTAQDMSAVERTGSISRMEAVQAALRDLLRLRLQVRGRTSRMALLGFNERASSWFPNDGGMAPLDAAASDAVIHEFEDAIRRMGFAAGGGTAIGPALHAAGDLLERHGREDNEKLVVLLSDGADYQARDPSEAGKMVEGLEDCVQVMADLHQRGRIRLHAVGVGDPVRFQQWWRARYANAESKGWAPNHELLRRLVAVGGGDPERCGDTEVLRSVFAGLATGRVTDLPRLEMASYPTLTEVELAQLGSYARAPATQPNVAEDLSKLAEQVTAGWLACGRSAFQRTGLYLFQPQSVDATETFVGGFLRRPAADRTAFDQWILRLWKVFWEARTLPADKSGRLQYPIPKVPEILYSPAFTDIRDLRHAYCHDPSIPGNGDQNRMSANLGRKLGRVWDRRRPGMGEPTDADGWSGLQVSLLRDLVVALEEIDLALRRGPNDSSPSDSTPSAAVPDPRPGDATPKGGAARPTVTVEFIP